MPIESKTQLKTYFETNDIPTEGQFENLIDSLRDIPNIRAMDGLTGTTSGTGTYTVGLTPALTAYVAGHMYYIKFANGNAAASPTLNIDGLGATAMIYQDGSTIGQGDIIAGTIYKCTYNGTEFEIDFLISDVALANFIKGFSTGTIPSTAFFPYAKSALGLNSTGVAEIADLVELFDAYYRSKGANVASATTPDITTNPQPFIHITGNTQIDGFASAAAGIWKLIVFDADPQLTHNATSMILPTAANIIAAAGDTALFISEGSGNWRCLHYMRADGTALLSSAMTVGDPVSGGGNNEIMFVDGSGNLLTNPDFTYDGTILRVEKNDGSTQLIDFFKGLITNQTGGLSYRFFQYYAEMIFSANNLVVAGSGADLILKSSTANKDTVLSVIDNSAVEHFAKLKPTGAFRVEVLSAPNSGDIVAGNATLVGGTVDVTTTRATATCIVLLTRKTAGGTIGDLTYTISAGTKITINSASGADTSTVSFMIVETH